MREEDHVANAWAVGEQHHHPVDTNPATARWRHAVFKRANVVGVVEHGFFVACIFLVDLLLEAGGLVFGIVQLGESVRDLAARNEQFEALRDARSRVAGGGASVLISSRQWVL